MRIKNTTILRNNYKNRSQKLSYRFCFISRKDCFKYKLIESISRVNNRKLF